MSLDHLRALRQSRGLTQAHMANLLEIDRTTYVKYETGGSEPDFKTIQRLADHFAVSVDYLLARTSDPAPPGESSEEPLDPDIRSIQRAFKKMNSHNRKKMMDLLKISFEEEFRDGESGL